MLLHYQHPRGPSLLWMESFRTRTTTTLLCRSSNTVSIQLRMQQSPRTSISDPQGFSASFVSAKPTKEVLKPLSWVNPSDSLQLFNATKEIQSILSNKWERAIICFWVNLPKDLKKRLLSSQKNVNSASSKHFFPLVTKEPVSFVQH